MKQGTEKIITARWSPSVPVRRKPSLRVYVMVIIATGVLIACITLMPWPGHAGKALGGQQPTSSTSTADDKATESAADNKAIEGGIIIIKVRIKKAKEENKKQREIVKKKQNQPQSAQDRAMLQVAREQNNLVAETLKLVEEAKKRVESAPNSAAKSVALRDVEDKMRLVQKHQQRANAAANPSPAQPVLTQSGPQRPSGTINFKSTYDKLVEITKSNGEVYGYVGVKNADPPGYDPRLHILVTPDGTRVDVTPVVEAANKKLGSLRKPGDNPFQPVTLPNGKKVYRLTPEAREALSALAADGDERKIGGVALEVTLDLLSFLGVPDFRHRGPSIRVEKPVLLSLAGLYERVQSYAKNAERWRELPDKLRYPGALDRIYGFVLDTDRQDIFLVGSRAATPRDRIDIDTLILGLQTVWREGQIPSVSLDSLPGRPDGPQRSTVCGVPFNSVAAKIMLDADYSMKRINFGEMDVGIEGFMKLNKLIVSDGDYASRYWLEPITLTPGDVHVSATLRSVLFATGVKLLTEEETKAGYTGRPHKIGKEKAKLFTRSYDYLEHTEKVEPLGIYLRLHGFVDIVTLCKLLRDTNIRYGLLDDFSGLPVRSLSVPASYPGISFKILEVKTGEDDRYEYFVSRSLEGGAVLRARGTRRAVDRYQDAVTTGLEHAVDTFPRNQTFARPLALTLFLPQASGEGRTKLDYDMLAGLHALEAGDYEIAKRQFADVTKADPFYADAWEGLAESLSMLGEHKEAFRAIGKAQELDPEELLFVRTKLNLVLNVDKKASENKELGDLAFKQENYMEAKRKYVEVTKAIPYYADAWGVLGSTAFQLNEYDQALAAIDKALELEPTRPIHLKRKALVLGYVGIEALKRGEVQLAHRYFAELTRVDPADDQGWLGLSGTHFLQWEYSEALTAVRKARELDPKTRRILEGRLLGFVALDEQKHELARQRFKEVIQIDTEDAWTWAGLAQSLSGLEKHEEASRAIGKAQELNPQEVSFEITELDILSNVDENVLEYLRLGDAAFLQEDYEEAKQRYAEVTVVVPFYDEARWSLATTHYMLHEYDQALQVIRKTTRIDSTKTQGTSFKITFLRTAGLQAIAKKQWEMARQWLSELTRWEPKDADAWSDLARAHFGLKEYEEALQAIDKALELRPMLEEYLELQFDMVDGSGAAALEAQDYVLARQRFEEAIQLNPESETPWMGLAEALLALGRHDEALQAAEKARTLVPTDKNLEELVADLQARALAARQKGPSGMATRVCGPGVSVQDCFLSLEYASEATSLLGRGDRIKARTQAETAIMHWQNNADAWLVKAMSWDDPLSEQARKDRRKAIDVYRKLMQGDEGEKWRRGLAFALSHSAEMQLKGLRKFSARESYKDWKGKRLVTEAALEELDSIIKEVTEAKCLDPMMGWAWTTEAQARAVRANMLRDMGMPGDLEKARTVAYQAVKRFPDFPDAHLAMAVVTTFQAKALGIPAVVAVLKSEVFDSLATAIRLDPTFGQAFVYRAGMYAAFNQCDKALDDLLRAQSVLPTLDPIIEQRINQMCMPDK